MSAKDCVSHRNTLSNHSCPRWCHQGHHSDCPLSWAAHRCHCWQILKQGLSALQSLLWEPRVGSGSSAVSQPQLPLSEADSWGSLSGAMGRTEQLGLAEHRGGAAALSLQGCPLPFAGQLLLPGLATQAEKLGKIPTFKIPRRS